MATQLRDGELWQLFLAGWYVASMKLLLVVIATTFARLTRTAVTITKPSVRLLRKGQDLLAAHFLGI